MDINEGVNTRETDGDGRRSINGLRLSSNPISIYSHTKTDKIASYASLLRDMGLWHLPSDPPTDSSSLSHVSPTPFNKIINRTPPGNSITPDLCRSACELDLNLGYGYIAGDEATEIMSPLRTN